MQTETSPDAAPQAQITRALVLAAVLLSCSLVLAYGLVAFVATLFLFGVL